MKKYFIKFVALSVAATLGTAMLASCGKQANNEVSPKPQETMQEEKTTAPGSDTPASQADTTHENTDSE